MCPYRLRYLCSCFFYKMNIVKTVVHDVVGGNELCCWKKMYSVIKFFINIEIEQFSGIELLI